MKRQFSFWYYARLDDPRLKLRDDFVLFHADALSSFKMGYLNPCGWLAYWLDGVLFRKTFPVYAESTYPGNNCSAGMYCNDKSVELVSLGPLKRLSLGVSTDQTEIWDVIVMDSLNINELVSAL